MRGLKDQLHESQMINSFGTGVVCEEAMAPAESQYEDIEPDVEDLFYDDVSGASLPSDLVKKGREDELEIIEELKVWEIRPISECFDVTGKAPITTRWVDTNKGDVDSPDVRCRLVGRELKAFQLRDDVFSATPPLMAVMFLFSLFMTLNIPGASAGAAMCLMFLDISRAYFHSPATRDIYVKLPPERHVEGFCAKLLKSLYGTRDAGANFQRFVMEILTSGICDWYLFSVFGPTQKSIYFSFISR